MNVSLDKVFVTVFLLEKTRSRYLFSSDKLSIVLHSNFAHRVKVLIVVALCDIGL